MKTHALLTLILSVLAAATRPSLAQPSGQITYEVVRRIDLNQMRIIINGEQVKPGDPNFPSDIPDTRTFGQKVLFTDKFAKETRDEQNAVIRTFQGGPGGAPRTTNLGAPFEEQVFVDLANQKTITLLTVGKDKEAQIYRAETPIQRINGWQLTDQTKKIAGYTCRKATVPFRKDTYSVWFTTDVPVTYSPVPELTPETGLVLLIEGSREQFRATKVSLSSMSTTDVRPNTLAKTVTMDQLRDIREKAEADFRQQLELGRN